MKGDPVKTWTLSRVWVCFVALMIAAGCGGGAQTSDDDDGGGNGATASNDDAGDDDGDEELRPVHIGLSTGSLAVFMYYVGDTLGYYEEEGLDATITPTGGSSESSQQLAAENFDVAQGASSAMLAVMQSVPLYPFYSVITKEYRDLVVPADSDVGSVEDLEGATIGVSDLSGGEVPIVRYILDQAGIDPDTGTQIVAIGEEPATVLASFEQGRIDAYAGSKSGLVPVEVAGMELRSIFPETIESGPVEALVAGEEASQDQDLLARIGRATAKGTLFCQTNIDACLDVIGQDHPELVEDRETARTIVEVFSDLTQPEMQDGEPYYGATDEEGWGTYLDIYSSGEEPLIENPDAIDLDAWIVTGLQPEINDFDKDAVRQQAEDYES